MFGPNAHPLFVKEFVQTRTRSLLSRFRGDLALGNISYYINDDVFFTRVYVHNYFKFLCDADVSARYVIKCYDRSGVLVAEVKGNLTNTETEVLELKEIKGLDTFGVFRVYLIPTAPDMFIPHAHATIFFNEYYHPGSPNSIIAHSLHVPTPRHSDAIYTRTSPGLVVPEGFRPYVLIAGGCSFHPFMHPACASAEASFTNEKGKERKIPIPSMKPLQCQRLDFFAMDPGLQKHIGTRPFVLSIAGKDFLSKPFIFISNGTTTSGEHL